MSGLNDFEAVDALIESPALTCAFVPAMKGGSEPAILRRSLVRLLNLPLTTWLRRRFVALHCALAELSSIPHELWRDIAMTIDPTLLELDPEDPVAKGLQFIRDNAARVALAKVEAQIQAREREAEAREREAEAREHEARLAIARRMLARNVDPSVVAEDCQLPINTVFALTSE